jgi:ADP-heptose:LPS heptosyltransferase
MGDTLWGTPAIRAIKKKLPETSIDLLLQKQLMPLFHGNKNLRNLIPYHPQWYRQLVPLLTLLKYRYSHVLIFHANKDIRRIIPCLRTSSIWSHQYPDTIKGIQSKNIIRIDKPAHGILRCLMMVEEFQIPSDGTHMDIVLSKDEKNEAKFFLETHGTRSKEFIYLNIGGSVSHKQWPVDQFITLTNLILNNTSLKIILGGGPEDTHKINFINSQINQEGVIAATNRSLIENCALIKNAKVLVTPDSGPMHIGFSLKTPTISLFWRTDSKGLIRNKLNGENYCGPLNIDESLSSVLCGNFFNTSKGGVDSDSSTSKLILASDVWKKMLKFL